MAQKSPERRVMVRILALLGLTILFVGLPVPVTAYEPVADAYEIGMPEMSRSDGSELAAVEHGHEFDRGHRLRGRADRVARFSMVGVSFEEPPVGPVLVRVRETGGTWGDWFELPVNDAEGPDADSPEGRSASSVDGYRTEPVWVADADGYELSVAESDADGSNVIVVRESTRRVVVDATPLASGAYSAFAGLHPRSDWGARARRNPGAKPAARVDFGVVHHSVSTNSYTAAQVPGQLRSTQAYHMDGNGWDDIGYNFVVDKFGGIWEGRAGSIADAAVGAHAGGFNSGSVGVMVLGDYSSTQPSAAAKESIAKVIGWKFAQFGTPATGTTTQTSAGNAKYKAGTKITIPRVVGHRDVGATACPGTIHGNLGSIRTRTADWVKWFNAVNKPQGALDSVRSGVGAVTVSGWVTTDPTSSTTKVRITAGSRSTDLVASTAHASGTAAAGGRAAVGFSGTVTGIPPGAVKVCLNAIRSTGANQRTELNCKFVVVEDPDGRTPVGRVTTITPSPGRIALKGWALDPMSAAAAPYRIYVDGSLRASGVASLQAPGLPTAYSSTVGDRHGFDVSVVGIEAGWRELCVAVQSNQNGAFTNVACSYPLVSAHSPIGALEMARSTKPRTVDVAGWAIDFEKRTGIYTRIQVGSRSYMIGANKPHAVVNARYPEYGSLHGFASTLTADPGDQRVCAYGVNVGGGSDTLLGCKVVKVVK